MGPRRYVMSEFRAQRVREAGITVVLDDGFEIVVPPPECWPDKLPSGDEDQARSVIGDEGVDRYLAAGGTFKLLTAMILDAQGASAGE